MKILDRYIFLSFVKTFVSVFIILILIFLLQAVWVYISELAGKDLDVMVIAKLLFYIIPNLIPMVLPLTILVASIMTFGSFSENYEFAAMKSSGISLQRAMRSLIFFISILSITTFFFANDVIPWSRYKTINLRRNISKLKPALAIVEGTFNQLGDYNIKVEKKTGKNGQDLHDVIIHVKQKRNLEMIVIKAKRGKLQGTEDSDILPLILYDGTVYQDVYTKTYKARQKSPFVKNEFDEYHFNIDLRGFNDVDLDDDQYTNSASMLNISELRTSLDSLSTAFMEDRKNLLSTISGRNGIDKILGKNKGAGGQPAMAEMPDKDEEIEEESAEEMKTVAEEDSMALAKVEEDLKATAATAKKDTPKEVKGKEETYDLANLEDFFDSYSSRFQRQIVNLAITSTEGTIRTIKGKREVFKKKEERLNVTEIEIYDKYALAVMCYVLFFVGAPLGAIIRKGGLGMPMVVAIILFLIYYYIGMFAKNSAKDGSLNPFIATWISAFIMLPLSVLVTYRATTDQGFFNPDTILSPIRKFFAKFGLAKRKHKNKADS